MNTEVDETNLNTPPETGRTLTMLGLLGTTLWLLVIATYSVVCRPGFSGLAPNEIGDFLAGAFAPLAFFWLVLGFFQQGAELRNSGRALWLQGEELRNSVTEQRALVEVTRKQLDLENERLTADRAHLADERERQRLLAEPKLELLTAHSISRGGQIVEQAFSLANHGAPCTRVVVASNDDVALARRDRLEAGDRIPFELRGASLADVNIITVTYLNQDRAPGSLKFSVQRTEAGLRIEAGPT